MCEGETAFNSRSEAVKRINASLGELAEQSDRLHSGNDCPWIVFSIENMEYAVNARKVTHVYMLVEIIPFEAAPDYCPGIIWGRGGLIRLLDLRVLFGQGNYRSAIAENSGAPPAIIAFELDGARRGIIVDRIVMMEMFEDLTVGLPDDGFRQSQYIAGTIKHKRLNTLVPVICPESFSGLEFEHENTNIDWKGRIDVGLLYQDK